MVSLCPASLGRAALAPFLFLLIVSISAAEDANITRYLYLEASASCPGNVLLMNASGSDGLPAEDIELRLVLYSPYQGLRALQHTDENGLASVELTKNGSYRIYMSTDEYNHEKYVEFEYPLMCPPPPPKQMDIAIEPDCADMRLKISVTSNETGAPLEGVFILAENWSSFTGQSGEVLLPFEEGYVYIMAERANFTPQEFYYLTSCAPPPECIVHSDCEPDEYCSGGGCMALSGDCGYAENHTWFVYQCCTDSDCGNGSLQCLNNTCIMKAVPPEPPEGNASNVSETQNQTASVANESGAQENNGSGACAGAMILTACLLTFFNKNGLGGHPG